MPSTKDGQKRISALELSYVSMQEKLVGIEKKLDGLCVKVDNLTLSLEPWKLTGHDNSKDIEELKLRLSKQEFTTERIQKSVERIDDTIKSAKAYVAGAMAVLVVLFTIAQYVIDKLVR